MAKIHPHFKKKSKKAVLITSLAAGILLSGCQLQTNQKNPPQSELNELTISVDSGLVTDDFLNFVEEFSVEQGIPFKIIDRPSGDAGENEVRTELLSGNSADILLFNSGGLFKSLDPKEYFYDLSKEDYTAQYIDSYKKSVSVGNEVYGLPIGNADAIGFIYSKELYQEMDLAIPANWADFMANLKRLKEEQVTPILTPFKDQWLTQYYWYAAELTTPDSGMKGYQKALEKIDLLNSNHFFSENLLTMSFSEGLDKLGRKTSAHLLGQYSFKKYLVTNHILDDQDVGFFPYPSEQNQYVYMLPSSLYINKRTRNLSICQKFFESYFSKNINKQTSSIEQPGILESAKIKPDKIIYEQQMNYKVDNLSELLLDYFTHTLTAEEVITQFQQRNDELKKIY